MHGKHSALRFTLFIKVLIIATLIEVATVAAASRPPCNHLAYLRGINYNLLVMDRVNQYYTNYSYFCSAQAPEQYACKCGHAESCHKQLDPWGHNIGRCGCCSPGMLVELILIIFVLLLLFILILYGYFGGRWLDNVWWFQGFPPPIIPVMARHGPYVPIPASEPLPHRLFRGYNTNDFVNEGSDNEEEDDYNNADNTINRTIEDNIQQILQYLHSEESSQPEAQHPVLQEEQEHHLHLAREEQEQQELSSEEEQNIFSVEHTDEYDEENEDVSVEEVEQDENMIPTLQYMRSENDNENVVPPIIHATEINTNPTQSNTNQSEPNAPFEKSRRVIHLNHDNNNNNNIHSIDDDDDGDNSHRHQDQQQRGNNHNNNCIVNATSKDQHSLVQQVPNNDDVEKEKNEESTNAVSTVNQLDTDNHDLDHHHHHHHHHRHHKHHREHQSGETSNREDANKNHDDRVKEDDRSNKENLNSSHVRSTSFVTVVRSNTSSVAPSLVNSQNEEQEIAEVNQIKCKYIT